MVFDDSYVMWNDKDFPTYDWTDFYLVIIVYQLNFLQKWKQFSLSVLQLLPWHNYKNTGSIKI